METPTDKFELLNEKKGSLPYAPQDAITNSNPDKFQVANGLYPSKGKKKSTADEMSADPDKESNHPVKWTMLSIHITGFIDKKTRPPCKRFAPSHHNHVALTQKSVPITHEGKQYDAHTISIYQESLDDVICQLKHKDFKDYDKTAVALLREICQGIRDLHKQHFYLGEFNEHTIIFSCDKSKIVTTDGTNSTSARATIHADFWCLARVFIFVLSKGGELNIQSCITLDQLKFGEKDLAKDIIETLISSASKMLHGTNQSPSEKQSIADKLSCIALNQQKFGENELAKDFIETLIPCITDILSCITLNQLKFGEKELAKDIIEALISSTLKMLYGTNQTPSQDQSITDILEHPFFWSDMQKVTFVCDAFDLVKEKGRRFQEKLNKKAIEKSVVTEDWFKEMELRSTEITAIKGDMKKSKNKKKTNSIQKHTIKHYAISKSANSFQCFYYDSNSESKLVPMKALKWSDFKEQKQNSDEIIAAARDKFGNRTIHIDGGFVIEMKGTANESERNMDNGNGVSQSEADKSNLSQQQDAQIPVKQSFFELLQFFRNQQCHFGETKELIRLCFQDQTTGYWNFFSSRFPKLLWFIYSERHDLFSGIRSARTHCGLDGNLITEILNTAHSNPVTNAA